MIYFKTDFTEAFDLTNLMIQNINTLNQVLESKGKERLKASNKASFKEQRSPDGEVWEKSKLSQIDPTGSPRLTMIRSTNLIQDTQNDSNYVMNGESLQEFTNAQSEKGFIYGQYWNEKKWTFAGFDIENIKGFQEDIINHVLKGTK